MVQISANYAHHFTQAVAFAALPLALDVKQDLIYLILLAQAVQCNMQHVKYAILHLAFSVSLVII